MSDLKDTHLENIRSIRPLLLQLLDGMDYCLDWKPDPSEWSVREVVYHLLDTPPGGIHDMLQGILSGHLREFDLWSDLSNINTERQAYDAKRVRQDVEQVLQTLEDTLQAANDEDLAGKSALVHQRSRGWDEPRTVQWLLEGLFARHWRAHLAQIRELRDALGV